MTVPYPKNAAIIEIIGNGKSLVKVSATSKLLRDAIWAVPDLAFINNPSNLRKALLSKADALDNMLKVGANKGAQQALIRDIRGKVQQWLLDNYVKSGVLEVDKKELLAIIDALIERVGNQVNAGSSSDLSLQDERTGDYLWFSASTGAYVFSRCIDGFTLSGIGQVPVVGCLRQLTHTRPDGITVKGSVNTCSTSYGGLTGYAGMASVKLASGQQLTLTDSNTRNNTLTCPSR